MTADKRTPFAREQRYTEPELQHLREALEQNTLFYAHGKKVHELEAQIASMYGVPHVVACSSGTAAIHTALIAAGISAGDEVITSPITDMGSVIPILWQGAVPVFADVHPTRHVITPETISPVITERTRAIIAVHLWGNACEVDALREICDSRGIILVEDCAQAWGTIYKGRLVGSYGHYGCLSLNEYKHISCGDGGLVLCNNEQDAHRARLATDKGYNRTAAGAERNPTFLANNYRMTELQAAVALGQLTKLDSIVSRRRSWCDRLNAGLTGTPGVVLPEVTTGCEPSWWFYMFRIKVVPGYNVIEQYAQRLQLRGLPVTAHYIGRCVYSYPIMLNYAALLEGRRMATQVYAAKQNCHAAQELLNNCIVLSINEAYSAQDLADAVQLIRTTLSEESSTQVHNSGDC